MNVHTLVTGLVVCSLGVIYFFHMLHGRKATQSSSFFSSPPSINANIYIRLRTPHDDDGTAGIHTSSIAPIILFAPRYIASRDRGIFLLHPSRLGVGGGVGAGVSYNFL